MLAPTSSPVTVVGAGLAGAEASFQLAERGFRVRLIDMKPTKRTPAQTSDSLCELVCSNSMRGSALSNAVGLLKEELRRMGSLVMKVADLTQVPAGGALAVDRDRFAAEVTRTLRAHPNITVVEEEVRRIPDERPVIIATGPLTSDDLAAHIAETIGNEHLAYYDAIAPIVAADSINWDKVFRQSRWDKGTAADGSSGDDAYVNCPFDEAEYNGFVAALVGAEKVVPRSFEKIRYFEGCLPVEVMAERGPMTLAFGPMKPVGLTDPRTGRRPHAVVQLRKEDESETAFNLVGFQTRMKHGEQLRVFRMIPGLEEAEFLRLGSVHRNTFVNAPVLLDETMQLKNVPLVFLAGQVSGVEGYVESAAGGFLCAVLLAERLRQPAAAPHFTFPPETTALGAILTHLKRVPVGASYQPSNVTWALFPPLTDGPARLKKRDRYERLAERALRDFEPYAREVRWPRPDNTEHVDSPQASAALPAE